MSNETYNKNQFKALSRLSVRVLYILELKYRQTLRKSIVSPLIQLGYNITLTDNLKMKQFIKNQSSYYE